MAQARDFAPHIATIQQSGAGTVITGNWGSDLALLIEAATAAGPLDTVKLHTCCAFGSGAPTAMGAGAAGKVYVVGCGHCNMERRSGR